MAHRSRLVVPILAVALAVAGCKTAPLPASPKTTGPRLDTAASPAPSPGISTAKVGIPPATLRSYFGRVLDTSGQPAVGIAIKAFVVSNNSGSLVSDDGAGLVTDNGSGVIANNGAGVIANNGAGVIANNGAGVITSHGAGLISESGGSAPTTHSNPYRILAADPTTTDAKGEFKLAIPDGETCNVEAAKGDELKALVTDVSNKSTGLELKLAPPGNIKGTVSFQENAKVVDFTGTDVFIPGSSYLAKAAADGSFTISNVPVGTYALFGTKRGLGGGHVPGIKVASKVTTDAGVLPLKRLPLKIKSVSPANGAAGTVIRIKGDHFGADQGLPVQVRLAGAVLEGAKVISEHEIKVKLPKTAVSGGLVVDVDGQVSPSIPFEVIKSFTVLAPRTLAPGSVTQLTVRAFTKKHTLIKAPELVWKLGSGTAVTVDAKGVVTAVAAGSATLTATSGKLISTIKLTVAAKSAGALGGKSDPLLHGLRAAALDTDGHSFYIASTDNVVRFDVASGALTLLAGASQPDDSVLRDVPGKGIQARFNGISGIALSTRSHTLYVLESATLRTVAMDGTVETVGGSDIDSSGNSEIPDPMDGPADQATIVAGTAVSIAPDGSVFLGDSASIRSFASDKSLTTIEASRGLAANDNTLWVDAHQVAWTLDGDLPQLTPYNGGSPVNFGGQVPTLAGAATGAASVNSAAAAYSLIKAVSSWGGMTGDNKGNFYISGDGYIFKISADGTPSVLAGGPAGTPLDGDETTARFGSEGSLIMGSDGAIYLAEDLALRKIVPTDAGHASVTTLLQGAESLKDWPAVKKPVAP